MKFNPIGHPGVLYVLIVHSSVKYSAKQSSYQAEANFLLSVAKKYFSQLCLLLLMFECIVFIHMVIF